MDSYEREPASVTLDIDDTCDVAHGQQQLSLFNAITTSAAFYRSMSMTPTEATLSPSCCGNGKRPPASRFAPICAASCDAFGAVGRWPGARTTASNYVFGLPGTKPLSRKVKSPPTRSAPELDLEIVATARLFSLAQRDAAIAISIAVPQEGRIFGRKLVDFRPFLNPSTDYLAAPPKIRQRSDLIGRRVIGYISKLLFTPELAKAPAFLPEHKIRIVLDGLRGEESIAKLCRDEGIATADKRP